VNAAALSTMTAATHTFASVHAEHGAFVWRVLRRMGVREADVADMAQEAFVVVHRKLSSFDGRSIKSWLFAICVRVAADYRKKAHVRREVATADPPDVGAAAGQHADLERARARLLLDRMLDQLDEDKRAVFVLYELEQLSMNEVADAVAVPLQTAYSRLHAARKQVTEAIGRHRQKESA
jgi:RNA polymerase sigma-70 factor, ECF subfamily